MHINAQLLCTTHKILEPRPLLSKKNAFKMAESVATNIVQMCIPWRYFSTLFFFQPTLSLFPYLFLLVWELFLETALFKEFAQPILQKRFDT